MFVLQKVSCAHPPPPSSLRAPLPLSRPAPPPLRASPNDGDSLLTEDPSETASDRRQGKKTPMSFKSSGKGRAKGHPAGKGALRGGGPVPRENSSGEGRERRPLKAFRVGDKVSGVVRVVSDIGLIVNIRAAQDAFLHESQLGEHGPLGGWKRGDRLVGKVKQVFASKNQLKLTLLDGGFKEAPYRIKVEELEAGAVYEGTVKKMMQVKDAEGWVRDGGAFIDIGCEVDVFLPSTPESFRNKGDACLVVVEGLEGLDPDAARKKKRVGGRVATKEEVEAEEEGGRGGYGEEEGEEEEEEEEEEVPVRSAGAAAKASQTAAAAKGGVETAAPQPAAVATQVAAAAQKAQAQGAAGAAAGSKPAKPKGKGSPGPGAGAPRDKRSLYGEGADRIKKEIEDKFSYLDDI